MNDANQPPAGSGDPVTAAAAEVFRTERMAVLATLIRQVGDIQLAEDAVQDAFAAAVGSWRRDGVPRSPGAWITVAARRAAIDRLRRDQSQAGRAGRLAELVRLDTEEHRPMADPEVIDDDRLRLIFTACHPALDLSARVALTLRVVGGLSTGEIARAFLVAEPAMGKRIVRAKRKIATARIPYRVPTDAELPARLPSVLRVTYLIFNEGYTASEGDTLVRGELCAEAIRLGRLLCELMPGEPEACGLLSLMLLHDARRAARVSPGGDWVGLLEQDSAQWDRARIEEGLAILKYALRAQRPGEYQLQAAIVALHIRGVAAGETDWAQLAQLYRRLAEQSRSPVAALNHAAAVGFAAGPEQGLELIAPLLGHPALARYQPLHATHADLLRRAGHKAAAASAYDRAISLSANTVERAELERRRQGL
jgi:RNA polymerase sigma-70 factor, ECF subfamily